MTQPEQLSIIDFPPNHQPQTNHYPEARLQIDIQQQDCIAFLQSLATQSVDLIVTDPAYSGMNNRLQLGRGKIIGQYKDKGQTDAKWFHEFEDTIENYTVFLNECQRVLKKTTGHLYIMFDSYSLLTLAPLVRDYFDVKNLITWDKINIGMGHYFRRRHEFIVFATNGNNRKLRRRNIPDVWRFKRVHQAPYPTQKPVEVFQAMIFASAEPGYIVCDPFVGSGSSAIAAIKNKCHFLGCDVAEKAITITQDRIRHYLEYAVDKYQPTIASLANETIFWE